jgi:uncharacterized protein
MRIDFDEAKDQFNREKHGFSLADAGSIDWSMALVKPDGKRDYGEFRMIGYTPIGDRLFCVVYVDRDSVRRIISLRKANLREIIKYEKAQADQADKG